MAHRTHYAQVETFVDVDVDYADLDTDTMIEELQDRGVSIVGKHLESNSAMLEEIYYKIQQKRNDEALKLMSDYIYNVIGRIITV